MPSDRHPFCMHNIGYTASGKWEKTNEEWNADIWYHDDTLDTNRCWIKLLFLYRFLIFILNTLSKWILNFFLNLPKKYFLPVITCHWLNGKKSKIYEMILFLLTAFAMKYWFLMILFSTSSKHFLLQREDIDNSII